MLFRPPNKQFDWMDNLTLQTIYQTTLAKTLLATMARPEHKCKGAIEANAIVV